MERKIRIDEAGHFYLNEFDISPFVVSHEMDGELVVVKLIGDFDKPKKKLKKKVKDER